MPMTINGNAAIRRGPIVIFELSVFRKFLIKSFIFAPLSREVFCSFTD